MDNKANEKRQAMMKPLRSSARFKRVKSTQRNYRVYSRRLSDRKATDIRLLRVAEKTVLTDYFVICTSIPTPRLRIAGEIEAKVAENTALPRSTEGYADANWILIDYGCAQSISSTARSAAFTTLKSYTPTQKKLISRAYRYGRRAGS